MERMYRRKKQIFTTFSYLSLFDLTNIDTFKRKVDSMGFTHLYPCTKHSVSLFILFQHLSSYWCCHGDEGTILGKNEQKDMSYCRHGGSLSGFLFKQLILLLKS